MGFLTGKTETHDNVNKPTSQLSKRLSKFLIPQIGDLTPGKPLSPEMLAPYLALFEMQNKRTFGQAKESAGNLTGSGTANLIGRSAEDATVRQSAMLADLQNQQRDYLAQLILGAMGSPAAGQTRTYTPGLLDYATQGTSALASGGFFNSKTT